MTEEEAKKIIKDVMTEERDKYFSSTLAYKELSEAMEITIKALEEVQQYRAIGTVEECKENKAFLEFLYDRILPNEMEQYLAMYKSSDTKTDRG